MPLAELAMYWRFLRGLPGFFHSRLSPKAAREIVERRLADREQRFLIMLERGVLGAPKSPYPALMRFAGCEFGDVKSMVRTRGLESTLIELRRAGVYVTFEEFKGHTPIVRGDQIIETKASDFDNPFLSRAFQAQSSGTTGVATRVSLDLDHYTAQAPLIMLAYLAQGVLEAPRAQWFGVLPDSTGVGSLLVMAPFGHIPKRWFVPDSPSGNGASLHGKLATATIIQIARMCGRPFPRPEPLPLDNAERLARWAAETTTEFGCCIISTHVSKALRVCIAAEEAGLDIKGTLFWMGGEPPTPAKVRTIRDAGAWHVPSYWFREAGCVGQGCATPVDDNDIHLFSDAHAVIQHERPVPCAEGVTVDAFCFSSLLPSAPKLMLNVESDDYGVIEERPCGCLLGDCGLTTHIRDIRSFRKLSSEGVTLVGSDVLKILEDVLPARFGGSPLDYQLQEEEDDRGFTRFTLVVSPTVPLSNESQLIEAVLEGFSSAGGGTACSRPVLQQAETLRVRRAEPTWTSAGKLMPLHMNRRGDTMD